MCEGKQPAWLAEAQARRARGPGMGEEQGTPHSRGLCGRVGRKWDGPLYHGKVPGGLLCCPIFTLEEGIWVRSSRLEARQHWGTDRRYGASGYLQGMGPSEGTGAEALGRPCEGVTTF